MRACGLKRAPAVQRAAGMLSQRRKLLQYLRRTDFDAYAGMLSELGLKDTYAKQVRHGCSFALPSACVFEGAVGD